MCRVYFNNGIFQNGETTMTLQQLVQSDTQCAYKQTGYYDKCSGCPGTPDIEMCYISKPDLKDHLMEFHRLRLVEEMGKL